MYLRFPILILDGSDVGPENTPLTKDNVKFHTSCIVSRNFQKGRYGDRLGVCKLTLVEEEVGRMLWAVWDFPSSKLPKDFHLYPAVGGTWDKKTGIFHIDEVAICLSPNVDPRIKSLQYYAGVEVVEKVKEPEITQVEPTDADKTHTP